MTLSPYDSAEKLCLPAARPLRWVARRGPGRKRIYLTEGQRFWIAREDLPEGRGYRLQVFRKLGLGNLSLMFLGLAMGLGIGLLAMALRRPEVGWVMIGLGLLGSLITSQSILADFIQARRLPSPLSEWRPGQDLQLFDSHYRVPPEETRLRYTRWLKSAQPSHRDAHEFDVIWQSGSETRVFPVLGTTHDHRNRCRQLAEQWATLVQQPLETENRKWPV